MPETPEKITKLRLLDSLLGQVRGELGQKEKGIVSTETSFLTTETETALAIERDILAAEQDHTLKLEKGLWIGAHIVCLPFFYDEYTVRASLSPEMQKKYTQAIITTCGRFKAMGKTGIALVSPITTYMRSHADYSPQERKELEEELLKRVLQWLKSEACTDTEPRVCEFPSLQKVMLDIEQAEQVFSPVGGKPNLHTAYMEGEVRVAALQAIAHSDFLPPQVKYSLVEDLKSLSPDQVNDIGTFLLWEMRKSSLHHNKLLYFMLLLFKMLL